MRKVVMGLLLALTLLLVATSSTLAADGPTWRSGRADFQTSVQSPAFQISLVPNTKTGSNYIDIDYRCPSATKYKVELFTAAGALEDRVTVSCKNVGVAYWLNNHRKGAHFLKFTKTAGSGTIHISHYRYHYVRFER